MIDGGSAQLSSALDAVVVVSNASWVGSISTELGLMTSKYRSFVLNIKCTCMYDVCIYVSITKEVCFCSSSCCYLPMQFVTIKIGRCCPMILMCLSYPWE
jgi:hypothetical protein